MFSTPLPKKQPTFSTQYSTNISKLSRKLTYQSTNSTLNQSKLLRSGSNKSAQKISQIAKLNLNIFKQKVQNNNNGLLLKTDSPVFRINTHKYKPKIDIVTKMSSKNNNNIYAYGVSTTLGYRNSINPHQIGIHLAERQHVILAESFQGIAAAKIVKDQFANQLMENISNHNLQNSIYEIFNKIQQKVMKVQNQKGQNSGSSLASVIINQDIIMVANVGCSQVVCRTKNGSYLKLSNQHTTKNENEVKRIIKMGGKIYQTIVNVPFQQQLKLQGPVRLAPSGLVYTRCFGRTYDYKRQMNVNYIQNCEEQICLTWRPQLKYIRTDQVLWIGIFSQSILNNMTLQHIQQLAQRQIRKKSQNNTEHHIASEISRKILTQLTNDGVGEALSAIILFISPITEYQQPKNTKITIKSRRLDTSVSKQRQGSLTYAGNRKSFVKNITVNPKKSYLYNQLKKGNGTTSERVLKKDFSFNNFH